MRKQQLNSLGRVLASNQHSALRKVCFEPLTGLHPREPKKQAKIFSNGRSLVVGQRTRPQGRPRTQWVQMLIRPILRHTQYSTSNLVNLAKDTSNWKELVEGLCRRLENTHA